MAELRDALQAALGSGYTVERELHGGGMSRVFVATETALARPIVVKVLPPEAAAAVSLERFHREIKLAARLQHPHIVPVLSAGRTIDGIPFYTMPFVKGDSLRARIERTGELSVHEAVRVLRDVAAALAYAHAEGAIHRDIKPDNVLLSGGVAVVIDFGVAKAIDVARHDGAAERSGVTSLGVALGTPAYMSPEQASADVNVDHRTDIYSFGCLAYELLTGTSPFANRSPRHMLSAHVTEPPEEITRRRPGVPAAVATLVMRCLEKRPADRWQSADELVQQLDALPTLSGRVAPVGHPWSALPGSRRWMLGLAAVVAAAGYVGARRLGTHAAGDDRSLAVLTFTTIGADTGARYLAEGLADGITTSLSGVRRLTVVSRTAVRRLADTGARSTPGGLGRSLRAAHLVGGSIQRAGARLLVTVELVRSESGEQLWTARYDTVASDVLGLQASVAQAVASAIAGRLLAAERTQVALKPTTDPVAYDHYMRGNRLLWTGAPAAVLGAIGEYEEALNRDSTFTSALGRLAYSYALALNWAYRPGGLPSDSVLARGLAAAEQALRRDSTNSDAWLGLGLVLFFRGTSADLARATDALDRAVVLDASNDAAHNWYGAVLRRMGLFDEAEQEYHRALAINPNQVQAVNDLGFIAMTRRSYGIAARWYEKSAQIDSTYMSTYTRLAVARSGASDHAGALGAARAALRLATETERARALATLAYVEGRAGYRSDAERHFDEAFLALRPSESPTAGSYNVRDTWELAMAAVSVGRAEVALDILERTRPRGPWLWSYLVLEAFDPVRETPRFRRIIDQARPPGATDPRR
jgi:TolB-like protein/tetratricopeptide (TPR) repeat protein